MRQCFVTHNRAPNLPDENVASLGIGNIAVIEDCSLLVFSSISL